MRSTGVAPPSDRENQQGAKSCNCKKSNCLKLYCDCFASSSYCSPSRCNCTACFNNLESENSRRIAVISTIERNPNAFRSKILSSNSSKSASQNQSAAEVALHHKGCHCKKSNCLKKYCECFQLGIVCSDRCRCNNCKNFPGSVERNKCLTVGIKEISQIIRKSESSLNTLESESAPPSAASSSSLSTSSAGPPDVALVRRLDDLGAILTHDVISKVCQSMLQTVFEESQRSQSEAKRKRNLILDVFDQVSVTKKAKVDLQVTEADASDGADSTKILEGKATLASDGQVDVSDVEQSKLIVTKLLQVFGMSVLGAVRSLPAHNEVDMSLGIAGLYSLKMEKDRTVGSLADSSEDSLGQSNADAPHRPHTVERDIVSQGQKSTHPFAVRSPKTLSLLPSLSVCSETQLVSAESSQTDGDNSGDESAFTSAPSTSTSTTLSAPWQLSQTDMTTSVNSSTTTEEQLTQDSPEDGSDEAVSVGLSSPVLNHKTRSVLQPERSPFLMKTFSLEKGISPTPLFAKTDGVSAVDKPDLYPGNVSSARRIEHLVGNLSDGVRGTAEKLPAEIIFSAKLESPMLIPLDPTGALDLENIEEYQDRTKCSHVSDLSLMTAVND